MKSLFFVSRRLKMFDEDFGIFFPLLCCAASSSSPNANAGRKRLYNSRRIDGKCMGTSKRSSLIQSIDWSRVCLILLVRVLLAHLSSKASIINSQFSGWIKRAKSACSFFVRPPLCSKINLEYLKIDYTSIRTPDQMAYNGKPLGGWWSAKNVQISSFNFKVLIRNSRIFSVRMLLFNQEQHMEMKSYKCRGEI